MVINMVLITRKIFHFSYRKLPSTLSRASSTIVNSKSDTELKMMWNKDENWTAGWTRLTGNHSEFHFQVWLDVKPSTDAINMLYIVRTDSKRGNVRLESKHMLMQWKMHERESSISAQDLQNAFVSKHQQLIPKLFPK